MTDKQSDSSVELDFLALWRKLYNLSGRQTSEAESRGMKLPIEALDWSDWIEVNEKEFIGGGGFGDVFKGKWSNIPHIVGPLPELVLKVVKVGPIGTKMAEKRYKVLRSLFISSTHNCVL